MNTSSQSLPKKEKAKPFRDKGYFIPQPCPDCGGRVRTWVEGARIRGGDESAQGGERVARCFSCWRDQTDFVNAIIAKGLNKR